MTRKEVKIEITYHCDENNPVKCGETIVGTYEIFDIEHQGGTNKDKFFMYEIIKREIKFLDKNKWVVWIHPHPEHKARMNFCPKHGPPWRFKED